MMATNWCEGHSDAANTTVNCQHLCEMILAFRTPATAAVYFRDPTARAQLWNMGDTLRRVWHRARSALCGGHAASAGGGRVAFSEDREMLVIPGREVDDGAPARPVSAADDGVRMMGGMAFERLLELDDAADTEAELGRGVDYQLIEDQQN